MKWITLVSFIIALASMPASAQKPHPHKGVTLGKKGIISDVSKFDTDRSGIASEWAKQQMLLALKANKFPFSEDFSPAILYADVAVIEVRDNSDRIFSYAWTVSMRYYHLDTSTLPPTEQIHWEASGSFGTIPDKARLKTTLRDKIRDQVDEFCAAYYTAN